MIEQDKLLECMEEIKAIAASSQGRLTIEEVQQYLDGMGLDGPQMNAVYQYLVSQGIRVEGYQGVPEQPIAAASPSEAEKRGKKQDARSRAGGSAGKNAGSGSKRTKAQRNLLLYQREVAALPGGSRDEKFQKMRDFMRGETGLREDILCGQLPFVIQIAGEYRKRGVPEEEIIAEGNLGLMNAMAFLESRRELFLRPDGEVDLEQIYDRIEREVRQAMEAMIDGQNENKDRENTIVARTNLLHEAAKFLAEELGRTATREELSEYTKIPLQEIDDLTGLSEDIRKVAGS